MHDQSPTEPTNLVEKPQPSSDREDAAGLRPSIYVASLADYNDGRLHGTWIDATSDPASIHHAITAMLGRSRNPGAEEYAIHDYSGFCGFAVREYDTIDTVHEIACGIAEHGEAFSAYVDLVGTETATETSFSDSYHGTYPTFRAFADSFIDSMSWDSDIERFGDKTGLGPFLTFDYDSFEATIRSEWSVMDGREGVHIFTP